MENAGESPDDRVQDAVARSREVRTYVDTVWPAVDAKRVLWQLFSDAQSMADCATGVLTPEEQAKLLWSKPARTPGSARWSAADAVLVDELVDLLDRSTSVGHVVLDEAQDLSPMQLRAVGRRCTTGSATVLGDVAQGTTPWATPSWEASLTHLGKAGSTVTVLERGFRVPRTVIEFASRLLPLIAPGLAPATSVRESPGDLDIVRTSVSGLALAVARSARKALEREGSVGVIAADSRAARVATALRADGLDVQLLGGDDAYARLVVVPATLAKGLEYDSVLVVEPADIVAAEASEQVGLRRLYVCLTRAVTALAVVHAAPLPGALAGPATPGA
jgi:DNA helicase IV